MAFDLGTVTGWASFNDGVRFGQFDVSSKDDCRAQRLHRFAHHVQRKVEDLRPDEIWYEFTVQRGEAARWFSSWEAILLWQAFSYDIACHNVNGATLKKWATGNGMAAKDRMVSSAESFLCMHSTTPQVIEPMARPTYDEADAICVLAYAMENRP